MTTPASWPDAGLLETGAHTLPREKVLGKLRSLANLRVVRDPSAGNSWKVEVGPFPGWKNVPTW